MVKLRKTSAAILSIALLAGSLSACSGSSGGSSAAPAPSGGSTAAPASSTPAGSQQASEAPAAEVSGDVKIMFNVTGGKDDKEMALFAKALGEATGLNIIAEKPPSDYTTVMMQKLQSGEKYDLLQTNAGTYLELVEQGALMDITDRVNASDILANNIDPKEWADITVDGKVYGGFNKIELHRVVALNKNHLEAAGIDYKSIEPTLDGYYEVMKKLKEANAGTADYYPFNGVISEAYDLQPWMAVAGLKDGVVIDSDGQRYSPYTSDEAAQVWEWLKKLYDEGLMDPGSFVDKTKDMRDKMSAASQKTSVCVDWAMWVGLHNANAEAGGVALDEYEIVSLPGVKTPDGGHMLVKGSASLFIVPNNAENADGAIKVLEYFATQEGGDLLSIGIEGYDYNMVDGKVEFTEIGAAHSKDHGAPIPIYKDWVPPAGLNRGVEEGLSYLQYATIDLIIPNEGEWKSTTGKWGIQIIRGETDTAAALKGMHDELIALDIIDK